jgi:hypothetical protein
MSIYTIVLFVHIIGAIGYFLSIGSWLFILVGLRRAVQPLDMVDNSINLSKHASGWFFRHWTVWTGHLILE